MYGAHWQGQRRVAAQRPLILSLGATSLRQLGRSPIKWLVQGLRKNLLKGTHLLELRKRVIRTAVEAKETLTKKQNG